MEIVALLGKRDSVAREAHRRWREEGTCTVGMQMYVQRAAQLLYGLMQ